MVDGESWASLAGTPTPILLKDTHIAPSLWDQTETFCELPLPLEMGSVAATGGGARRPGVAETSERAGVPPASSRPVGRSWVLPPEDDVESVGWAQGGRKLFCNHRRRAGGPRESLCALGVPFLSRVGRTGRA